MVIQGAGPEYSFMTPQEWANLKELLNQAMALPSEKRTTFIREGAESDFLAEEALSLLPYYEDATTMKKPRGQTTILPDQPQISFPILPSMVGKRVGDYVLKERFAPGGMGEVYLAERVEGGFKQKVAIKFIRQDMASKEFLERFRTEQQILADLTHENIARLYSGGSLEDQSPYIIMEFIEGQPIHIYCKKTGQSQKNRIQLFRQVCDAVHFAHQNQIVHRDIKSANILVTRDGSPKLLDFGIAQALRNKSERENKNRFFTPEYACPEQLKGEPSTTAGDIYSLGVLLYNLMTDKWPYDIKGKPVAEIVQHTLNQPPTPPSAYNSQIGQELEAIILKCLEKDPRNRYASARALDEDLKRMLDGRPVLVLSNNSIYTLKANLRKHKLAIFIGLFIASISAMALGWTLYERDQTREKARLSLVFGQEAERIEALIRYTYMLPRHDIRKEMSDIRIKIEDIEQRIRLEASNEFGYGDAALGRGYLALGDFEQAQTYLESAWDKGFQGPRVAFSLARTKGLIYEDRLERIEQEYRANKSTVEDIEDFEKLKKALDDLYLKPALQYLRMTGEAGTGETPFAAALLSFYEAYEKTFNSDSEEQNPFEDALHKAEEALTKQPWLFEASNLMGRIYLHRANMKRNRGAYKDAFSDFHKAAESYRQGIHTAPSLPRLYISGALTNDLTIQTMLYGPGGELEPLFQEGSLLCKQALEADPNNIHALRLNAMLHLRMGEYYASEPAAAPYLDKTIEIINKALALEPTDSECFALLGSAFFTRSKQSDNPEPDLVKAAEAQKKALAARPTYAAHNYLGRVYKALANYKQRKGKDPLPDWEQAVEQYKMATRLNKDLIGARVNLGYLFIERSGYQLRHGKDPLPDLELAVSVLGDALKINPKSVGANNNLALTLLTRAEYLQTHGADPRRDLLKADQYYQKVIEVNPARPEPQIGRGVVWFLLAEDNWDRGGDPQGDFQRAEEANLKALEIKPGYHYAINNLGHIDGIRAYQQFMEGANPTALIERSLETHQKTLNTSGREFALNRMSRLHLLSARHLLSQDANPDPEIRKAIQRAREALSSNPDQYEPHLAQGLGWILEARWSVKNDRSPESAFQKARESLDKALALNPEATEIFLAIGEWAQYRADWKDLRNPIRQQVIEEGVQILDKALKTNKNLAQAKAIKGVLLLIKGENTPPDERSGYFLDAETHLKEAISLHPRLENTYKTYLDRASHKLN